MRTSHHNRGSVLIAALLVAIIVALLCGSYVSLVMKEYSFSLRSLRMNSALNLAEAGVDAAMYDLKAKQVPGATWTVEKDVSGRVLYYHRPVITGRDMGQAAVGDASVLIENYVPGSTLSPVIISQGRVRYPGQPDIIKQVRVRLKPASSNPASGVVSKHTININGTDMVFDAYDSALGAYKAPVAPGVKASIGTVGSTNVTDGVTVTVLSPDASIAINKNKVYGHVSFAGPSSRGPDNNYDDRITWQWDNGNGGALYGSDTPGVMTDANGRVRAIFDKTKVIANNSITLPPPPPTPVNDGATRGTVLAAPGANDVYILGSPVATEENPTYYYINQNVSLNGNKTQIKVVGPVVLVMQGDLSVSGDQPGIQICKADNASLTLFVRNNININGKGIANDNWAADRFYLIPFGDSGQNISLGGSGDYRGVFYGPTFNANINGNGAWYGAIVANAISITGSGGFHFDEQCGKRLAGTSGYSVNKWLELTNESGGTYARDARKPFTSTSANNKRESTSSDSED